MGEPKGPSHDGTHMLEDTDLVEVDSSRPKVPDDSWFIDESGNQPPRRADTLDAFLDDLQAPPPRSSKPSVPPPKPAARPVPPPKPAAKPPQVRVPKATDTRPGHAPARASTKPAEDPLELFRPASATAPTALHQAVPEPSERTADPVDDERLLREVQALAGALPTRAALLQAFRARVALDLHGDLATAEGLAKRAAELAPDVRCVAMTTRWIASHKRDTVGTIAAARAELPLAGDASERLGLLWQIAMLEAPQPAEATLKQILELDPQDHAAHLALAASAMQRKAWAPAADAFDALANRTDDVIARAAFHAAGAGLRDAHAKDLDGARRGFDRALEADPTSASAHSGLQTIYLRTKAPVELARVVWFEAQRVGDLDPALAYHEHAGDLLWECVRDASAAARSYEQAASLAHADVVQLGKVASLYEQEGRYPLLAAVYERLLERIGDPLRRGAVLHRLGTLYETRLDDPEQAIRCYRAALDAVPTLAPAAQALAHIYLAHKRWTEAASVLLVEVDRLADASVRASRYVAIAELLEPQVGASPQVVTLLERALALDPGQTAALDALDRMYRAAGRWDDIIALHEAQLAQTSHPLRSRALRLALASLYLDRAAAPDKAAEQLRAALVGPPDRFFMLVALQRALAEAGKWTEHVAILEQQAKLVGDGVELVAVLYRIATVVENRLGDPARALTAYRRVLESQPRHELALQAVLRLHRGQARWEDVIASERKLLELTERPEEAAVILHRIALVAEDQLSRAGDAIDAYEAALRQLPGYRPARVALERLLRAANRYDRLAALLEEQAGGATGADKARLLCQAALVRELHGAGRRETEAAAKLYEDALAVEAAMPTALWGLLRIRSAAADWKGVAATLGLLVRQARHDRSRARLLVQVARIHEMRLGDVTRATELLGAALSADAMPAIVFERLRLAVGYASEPLGEQVPLGHSDDDAPRWLDEAARVSTDPAMVASLLRLRAALCEQRDEGAGDAWAKALLASGSPTVLEGYARCAHGGQLATALAQRAQTIKDAPSRALLYTLAGALADRRDAADAAYREALGAQPDFMPALGGRRALAEAAGDWKAAAALSAEQAAAAQHPTNKVELYELAAQLCVERLGHDALAIEHYRAALAAEPGRRSSLDQALDLLEQSGDWGQAAALIADQAGAIRDEVARADLLARRARILAERLGDADGAIANLDYALALRPGNPELLQLLAGLHESLGHWADAARVYDQLGQGSDPGHRRAALVAQARIWTTEVPDYARAQRLLEQARELEPTDRGVLASLAEIAVKAGDLDRATALYEELARSGRAGERVGAMLAVVDLRKKRGMGTDAHAALAAGFALAFEDASVVGVLEQHYRAGNDLAGYVAAAEAALAGRSGPETTPMRVSLGLIYARELAASERAVPYLRAAVTAVPEDARLRVALASALAGRDDVAAVAELRKAIELDPTDPLPYRKLAGVCTQADMAIAASLASSAAALLGDDDAVARVPQQLVAIDSPIAGALPPDDAFGIAVGQTRVFDVRRIVAHLDPYLPELFPHHQEALRSTSPVPERHAIVGVVRALAAALGAPPLAIMGRERGAPALLVTDPRAFAIAREHVSDDAIAYIRFEAAGAIARVAAGTALGLAAPIAEVTALLAAIDDADAPDPHDFRKRVASALPRRARKDLEKLVADVGSIDANAVAQWDREEQLRAARVGIVACGDLRAAARSLCPEALAAGSPTDRRLRIRANPRMLDTLRFAVSEACWSTCRRLYGRS